MNNVALGFTFLFIGLAVFASAVNKTTGAMLAGLIYGEGSLKKPIGSTKLPTITQGKDSPIPGLVVPDVTPSYGPNVFKSLNPGMHNPIVKP